MMPEGMSGQTSILGLLAEILNPLPTPIGPFKILISMYSEVMGPGGVIGLLGPGYWDWGAGKPSDPRRSKCVPRALVKWRSLKITPKISALALPMGSNSFSSCVLF